MFKNYFSTALRNIFRNRVYSFINIAGLSLGLTCAILILLYVKDEISYDRFHKNIHQVYRIGRKIVNPDGSILATDGYTGFIHGPQFAAQVPEIRAFVRLMYGHKDIKTGTDVQSQEVHYADSNFLSVFSFPLLKGNPQTALLGPKSVVISEQFAKKQFGTTDILGKMLLLKDKDAFVPYTVTGIAGNCPQNSSIKFHILLPLHLSKEQEQDDEAWLNSFLNTFVVLNPGADISVTEAKMKKVYETDAAKATKLAAERYGTTWIPLYTLQPFTAIHLSKDYPAMDGLSDASNAMFSYILSGIALFILLIACINFINLTIARSVKRAKEIGVRKVMGGTRKQLALQFLGESFLWCFAAFVLALFLAQALLPVFSRLSGKALAFSLLPDGKLIAAYTGIFIVTGLLAGCYPAIVLSGYQPVQTLYARFRLGGKNYLQKTLVITQFSLASFLIIAAMTIFSQYNFLTSKNLGYDDTNLVTINHRMTPKEARLFGEILMQNPNIVTVAPKSRDYRNSSAKVNGGTGVPVVWETVDESYIPLLKLRVTMGRNFSKDFPSDSAQAVIVNEAFAQQAGWKNPIGQQVNIFTGKTKYTVIGVVKNYHFQPLSDAIKPQVFTMKSDNPYGTVFIKIKPNSEAASLPQIEKGYKKLFPLSSYSYAFRDQLNRNNYQAEAKWKQILLFGAIVTIFISCVGLFGLSVFAAEKRTKEIGIRKVLGASVTGVAAMLSIDFLKLVIIALLISFPLARVAGVKWLQQYPYRVEINWKTFAAAGALVIIIALFTIAFQSVRAAMVNPVKSLKSE